MGGLLLALEAAQVLVPMLANTVQVIAQATAPIDPMPLSSSQADFVFAELDAAAKVAPALAGLSPLVAKVFSGQQLNDADLAILKVTADAIDVEVAKATADIMQAGERAARKQSGTITQPGTEV